MNLVEIFMTGKLIVYNGRAKMENIYTVSGNFLLFGKSIGFFPLSFAGPPEKGIFSTKWHDVVTLCVMLVTVSVLMVMNQMNKAYVESSSVMVTNAWNTYLNQC